MHARTDSIPVVAVAGPTASGKSALALTLAQEFGGEIVNCDSLQIYRGMDIGTAKPTPAERSAVPHHLFDLFNPDEIFNAGEYAQRARACILDIHSRARLPVLAGGTGFYLRALFEGLADGPTRDDRLRERLIHRESNRPGFLARLLRRLDPAAASRIHPNDINKLTRAVEVSLQTEGGITAMFDRPRDGFQGAVPLKLVLAPPRPALQERIALRTRRMVQDGLLEEVRALLAAGVPPTAKALESIGYRQACEVIEGRSGLEEAVEAITIATRQYAKRQITWFRRESGVHWLEGFGDEAPIQAAAKALLTGFLTKFTTDRSSGGTGG